MRPTANGYGPLAIVVVSALVIGVAILGSSEIRTPQTATQTTSSICTTTLPGQSSGVFVRVLNGSTSAPVAGASVTASAEISGIGVCGSSSQSSSAFQEQFTTNTTAWYPLPALNVGTYQIAVAYAGRTYSVSVPVALSVFSCATLYLPSGATNITTSNASCPSGAP